MVVNFKAREISRGTRKLARPTLNKTKNIIIENTYFKLIKKNKNFDLKSNLLFDLHLPLPLSIDVSYYRILLFFIL
jgi:hypothetical protein